MSGVRFTWGIKPELYVMPNSNIWRALRHGMIVRDMSFKPELKESQVAIYKFEEGLMSNPDYVTVLLPMHNFVTYLKKNSEPFPVPEEKFH